MPPPVQIHIPLCTWRESLRQPQCPNTSAHDLIGLDGDPWACLCSYHYDIYDKAMREYTINPSSDRAKKDVLRLWMKAQGVIQTHRRVFGTPAEFKESLMKVIKQSIKKDSKS